VPDLNKPQLHRLTVAEIFTLLGPREGGLSPEDAPQRLSRYGPHVLEEPRHYSVIRGFLLQFTHFPALLPWIATGMPTESGKIACLSTRVETDLSPLQKEITLLALITSTRLGTDIFRTSPLPAWIFGPLALGALVLFFAEEIRKIIVKRFTNSRAGNVMQQAGTS
jgi:hypothetical protein